jgi:hypothetical protein
MRRASGCSASWPLALVVAWSLPAVAADESKPCEGQFPCLQIEYGSWLRFDSIRSKGDGTHTRRIYPDKGELNVDLTWNAWLTTHAEVKSEPARTPRAGSSTILFGHALFLEQAFVNVATERFDVLAGKINPSFGFAYEPRIAPGIFAKDFAEDYEITEMLGFGMVWKTDLREWNLGSHLVRGQAFFQDNTFLHTSALTRPRFGQSTAERISDTTRGQGGPANTGKPNSFSAILQGGDFTRLPGLRYQASWARLHHGDDGGRNVQAFGLGFLYETVLGKVDNQDVRVKPIAELVRIANPGSERGRGLWWTLGTRIEIEPWYISPALGIRRLSQRNDVPSATDRFLTLTVEYHLLEQVTVGAGYKWQRSPQSDGPCTGTCHVFGLRVTILAEKAWSLR